jgi:hypothetical protein
MSDAQLVNGIVSTLSLIGIVVLVFWLYRGYRVDKFRQDMFALRDELFDFADSGAISFDDPAYGFLRRTMNGYIRFGHRLSLLHAVVFWTLSEPDSLRKPSESFDTQWNGVVNDVAPAVGEQLASFRSRMERLLIQHLVLNSPLLVLLIVPAIALYILARLCSNQLLSLLRPQVDDFDAAALAYGLESSPSTPAE